jgi:hypothetical protein
MLVMFLGIVTMILAVSYNGCTTVFTTTISYLAESSFEILTLLIVIHCKSNCNYKHYNTTVTTSVIIPLQSKYIRNFYDWQI